MYLREIFQVDDRDAQLGIIREDGWGHIMGVEDGVPFASHHPFVLLGDHGEEKLEFHMPKASPHLRSMLDGELKLVVFEGPKHYISPKWCDDERALPTWAYVAVHIRGRPHLIEDPAQIRLGLDRLVDFNEARFDNPWSLNSVDEAYADRTIRGILGFEMPIEQIEGNFRLLQNRPAEVRHSVAEALSRLPDTRAHEIAKLIRVHNVEAED
jgi:transcriptional regulator